MIATVGAARSSTTPSHLASERLAFSALWLWFGPFGLSGIDWSAAITQAHTGPSGAGWLPEPKSAVQVNVVDLPPPAGTEHAEL